MQVSISFHDIEDIIFTCYDVLKRLRVNNRFQYYLQSEDDKQRQSIFFPHQIFPERFLIVT